MIPGLMALTALVLCLPALGVAIGRLRVIRDHQSSPSANRAGKFGIFVGFGASCFYPALFLANALHPSIGANPQLCALASMASAAGALLSAFLDGESKWICVWSCLATTIVSPLLVLVLAFAWSAQNA